MTDPIHERVAAVLPDFWCPVCECECTSVDEDGCCSSCGATPAELREKLRPAVEAAMRETVREAAEFQHQVEITERAKTLTQARRAERERCAKLIEPRPGPEPHDFTDHRMRQSLRAHLAAAIRALRDEEPT